MSTATLPGVSQWATLRRAASQPAPERNAVMLAAKRHGIQPADIAQATGLSLTTVRRVTK